MQTIYGRVTWGRFSWNRISRCRFENEEEACFSSAQKNAPHLNNFFFLIRFVSIYVYTIFKLQTRSMYSGSSVCRTVPSLNCSLNRYFFYAVQIVWTIFVSSSLNLLNFVAIIFSINTNLFFETQFLNVMMFHPQMINHYYNAGVTSYSTLSYLQHILNRKSVYKSYN